MVFPNCQAKITDFVKKAYRDYFGVKLGDQDKPFAPHVCCKTRVENLNDWRNGKKKTMPFAIPMVWSEGKDHTTNYFCMINLKRINRKNKYHGSDLPIPEPDGNMEYSSDFEYSDMTVVADDAYKPEEDDQAFPLTQAKIDDLTRNLNFSKESTQLLGSRFKEKQLLAPGTTFYCISLMSAKLSARIAILFNRNHL